MDIKEAITESEIAECYPPIIELCPQIQTAEEFVKKVELQIEAGYHLMYIKDEETNTIASICAFRIIYHLRTGKTLYMENLSTLPFARGINEEFFRR